MGRGRLLRDPPESPRWHRAKRANPPLDRAIVAEDRTWLELDPLPRTHTRVGRMFDLLEVGDDVRQLR
jgi:hypothetical protein